MRLLRLILACETYGLDMAIAIEVRPLGLKGVCLLCPQPGVSLLHPVLTSGARAIPRSIDRDTPNTRHKQSWGSRYRGYAKKNKNLDSRKREATPTPKGER